MSDLLTPLASLEQVRRTPSREDGIPAELEDALRTHGCRMIQQAGVLLKLPQVVMATAQVLFQRFWFVTSLKHFGIRDIGMGCLFLSSKLEETPLRIRDLINVYHLLSTTSPDALTYEPMSYFSSTFYDYKDALVFSEMQVLKRLGFNVQVQLPYALMVNYLQIFKLADVPGVAQKAWSYLNDALQTPVYALFPPPTLATAAIYLTLRVMGIAMPESPEGDPWWTLFDAELEDIELVAAWILRLYDGPGGDGVIGAEAMLTKGDVRRWLEERQSVRGYGSKGGDWERRGSDGRDAGGDRLPDRRGDDYKR